MSRNQSIFFVLVINLVSIAFILSAFVTQGLSARTVGASLLIACFGIFSIGGVMYAGRAMWGWPLQETTAYLRWERAFIIAAIVATVLGLVLLEDLLRAAGDTYLARLGMVAFLFAAGQAVVAEGLYLGKNDWHYPLIVVYAVIGFVAQAAFGVALLQTNLVSAGVGWATILWNIGWLVMLVIFSRNNIYFPVLHHVAPLIIGIALLSTNPI